MNKWADWVGGVSMRLFENCEDFILLRLTFEGGLKIPTIRNLLIALVVWRFSWRMHCEKRR